MLGNRTRCQVPRNLKIPGFQAQHLQEAVHPGLDDGVRLAGLAHGADCLVIGSLIFFLKWLRTLGLPLVHTRFSPYASNPGESALVAHATHVSGLRQKVALLKRGELWACPQAAQWLRVSEDLTLV